MTLAIDNNANPIQVMTPVSTEALAVTTAAASAAARNTATNVVRIVCTQPCFYSLSGTATTSSVYLPAETVEYIKCAASDTLSVILATGSGTAYISECI
jgi:hypothetical protein